MFLRRSPRPGAALQPVGLLLVAALQRAGLLLVCCLSFATLAYGEETFQNSLSLQGYTGLLNIPTAEVADEGKVGLLYGNQRDSHFAGRTSREESYFFTVGLFPFFELGGRYTDAVGVSRDLSAHAKLRLPLPEGGLLPRIALGVQDVGGGLKYLETKYVVATKDWRRLRFSLGYGTGPARLDGLFGGVELKVFDGLSLLAENDAREWNAGLRMMTPRLFGWPVQVQATAKTSLDYEPGRLEFGLGLQIPLGGEDERPRPPVQNEAADPADGTEASTLGGTEASTFRGAGFAASVAPAERGPNDFAVKATGSAPSPSGRTPSPSGRAPLPSGRAPLPSDRTPLPSDRAPSPSDREPTASLPEGEGELRLLSERLIEAGFENVRVGRDGPGTLLVVEYENSRYLHNELDGLGVALGLITHFVASDFEILQLVLRKKGIAVVELAVPLAAARLFLQDGGDPARFSGALTVSAPTVADPEVRFLEGDGNPSRWKSEILLYPGLQTFLGTEIKNLDYLVSLKADYYLNLWKGGAVNARWDFPLTWSDNLEGGRPLSSYWKGNQMDRLMAFQTLKPGPHALINLGAGLVQPDAYGTINEVLWTPGDGRHRFSAYAAYARSSETGWQYADKKSLLGSYRYYYAALDLYVEGTAGQFFDNDRGFRIDLKRFFGDTALTVYYKNARTAAEPGALLGGERLQVAGVELSLPLTPRREMKPYAVRVRGADEWTYGKEVTIVTPGGKNWIYPYLGNRLLPTYNLERVFANRDRLSEGYIRQHLPRLRDAYVTFNGK